MGAGGLDARAVLAGHGKLVFGACLGACTRCFVRLSMRTC